MNTDDLHEDNRLFRPILFARWLEGDPVQIVSTDKVAFIAKGERNKARRLYEYADGTRTIFEIAALAHVSESEAFEFFAELKMQGMCFDAWSAAMFGHKMTNYPDPFIPRPSDAQKFALMKLPVDSAGVRVSLCGENDLHDVQRTSCREYTDVPLSLHAPSAIIRASYGITRCCDGVAFRSVPSAGAMYPLRHDFFVRSVSELAPGRWRLAANDNDLVHIGTYNEGELAKSFFDAVAAEIAITQVISFDITRPIQKYGSRAYRFALLEAGHAAQNAMRKAAELGVASLEVGGFADDALEQLCEISGETVGIATTIVYGTAALQSSLG